MEKVETSQELIARIKAEQDTNKMSTTELNLQLSRLSYDPNDNLCQSCQ